MEYGMIDYILITIFILSLSGCCMPCPLCIPWYYCCLIIFLGILVKLKIKWAKKFLDRIRGYCEEK